jgi:hypothetical protein
MPVTILRFYKTSTIKFRKRGSGDFKIRKEGHCKRKLWGHNHCFIPPYSAFLYFPGLGDN